MRSLIALPLLLMACSCSAQVADPAPAPTEEAATHPVSGLQVIPLTAHTPDGPHLLKVEVAATAQQQTQGLMFRTEMGADEGMLFPRAAPRMASFWMKNTVMSLDIIFIDGDKRVINVAAHTTPYSTDSIPSEAPALAILELNAGRAEELGIGPGTLIEW